MRTVVARQFWDNKVTDVRAKFIPPAINQVSFNCPHCGALAKQFWFSLHAEPMKKDSTPLVIYPEKLEVLNLDHIDEAVERERLLKWAERKAQGRPFIETNRQSIDYDLNNVSLSRCFSCNDVAIWRYDRLAWPQLGEAPLPNPDLPQNVRLDYDEAGTILDQSPRGAAALLRLGIQKMCKHLGEKGKNINDDIASLVKKGLDVRVQKALDVVRVVGNNMVHPGQIDPKDNRATAEKLFGLVNLIADIMISQPKHVSDMFDSLPETAKKAIENRDNK